MSTKAPIFAKRHYEAIALTLAMSGAPEAVIADFCLMLARDNPQFDRLRFCNACRPVPTVQE